MPKNHLQNLPPVDENYVAAVIAKLPPLTDEAIQRIAGLLLAGDPQ